MAKKRINIVLLLVVLGLWGTVAYKTITQYFFPKEMVINDQQFSGELNINEVKKDTFILQKISRDPFLNGQNDNPSDAAKTTVVRGPIVKPRIIQSRVVKPKAVIIWPVISYYGYIKSNVKTEALILVKIDNKLYKLRKNDDIEGVVIKKVYNDSIEVLFSNEKKIIKIK